VVSAWPEPPSASSAARPAGVHDGTEALALYGGIISAPQFRAASASNRPSASDCGLAVVLADPADSDADLVRSTGKMNALPECCDALRAEFLPPPLDS
jgi:hypothetical protein